MARPLRLEFPGAIYHVTARGDAQAVSGVTRVSANGGHVVVGCGSTAIDTLHFGDRP